MQAWSTRPNDFQIERADLAETAGIFTHNQNEKIVPVVEGDWSDCFELIVTQITTG